MQDETIGGYLEQLAARVPAPGGGAAAALHAAQAAALLAMVARYTTGEKYAEHAEKVASLIEEADELRITAVHLAEDDASAFTAVTEAYKLPRGDEAEKARRSEAIADALIGAARPPAGVIVAGGQLVALAEDLLPIGNPNVVTDIAAATDAARAAVTTARLNVEINLAGIKNPQVRAELTRILEDVDSVTARADAVSATIRTRLNP